jgi:hypothetical protein
MDIYCSKCAEPWDMDSIHEEIDFRYERSSPEDYAGAYATVKEDFFGRGCEAFTYAISGPCTPASEDAKDKAFISAALYSAFGDDLDGIASDMADLGW